MTTVLKYDLAGALLTIESGACQISDCESAPIISTKECVVLLHALGRTGYSMKRVERFLTQQGYNVVNVTYPSFCVPVERLAEDHLHRALTRRVPRDISRVHFVTHSMGGILLRQYLVSHRIDNLGRVVMLGPPNQGSEKADWFKSPTFMRWLTGPNLSRLGTGPDDLPQKLGPANFEVGIIAGDRPVFGWLLGNKIPSDGIVSVESTKIAGMKDFTTVHCSHAFMPNKREALEQIGKFIRTGQFSHVKN